MTYGTYGPRTPVHDTRQGVYKTLPQLWIVLHTSEGGEGVDSAEGLSRFMTTPATATNVASYNAVFDTDRILPAVEHSVVPYAAGGGNAQGIHGCFPGRANQTREQWLDPVSRAMIRQAAAWILDVATEFRIPLIQINRRHVSQYLMGITDHHEISLAFRKSTHTDVGDGFPWDVLFSDIAALTIVPPTPPTPQVPPFTLMEVGEMKLVKPNVRVVDTRNDGGGPRTLMAVQTGIIGAKAAAATVTVVPQGAPGFMSVNGGTSFLNFDGAEAIANTHIFEVQPDGAILMGSSTPVHIIVDLVAVFD